MSVSTPFQEEAHQHLSSGDVPAYMQALGQAARRSASQLRRADTGLKNSALMAMAQRVEAARGRILDANGEDLQRGRESGLESALLDRLALNDARIDAMIEGLSLIHI
jgi:glutamate-5-semialdehyde dehydrogenase